MVEINLLPPEFRPKPKWRMRHWVVLLLLVSFSCGLGYGYYWMNLHVGHMRQEIAGIEKEFLLLQETKEVIRSLKRSNEEMLKAQIILAQLHDRKFHFAGEIESLLPLIPEGVELYDMELFEDHMLTLMGTAPKSLDVYEFYIALNTSSDFENVVYDYIEVIGEEQSEIIGIQQPEIEGEEPLEMVRTIRSNFTDFEISCYVAPEGSQP